MDKKPFLMEEILFLRILLKLSLLKGKDPYHEKANNNLVIFMQKRNSFKVSYILIKYEYIILQFRGAGCLYPVVQIRKVTNSNPSRRGFFTFVLFLRSARFELHKVKS